MAVHLGSHLVSLFGGQPVEGSNLNIKKFTATLGADSTSAVTLLTDDFLKEVRNNPNGFVIVRHLGLASGVACNMFWFTANFTIGYSNSTSPATAYNSMLIRATASGSIQGNFNTNGLVGTNYNGHINITASGGLYFSNNATYPMKAGTYEIYAGIWADSPSGYTNLIPLSEEVASSAIYNNGLGYKNGYYISVGNESANVNDCMTGCIPYVINGSQPTDVLYIKGYTAETNASHTRMCVRKADKSSVSEYNGFLNSNGVFDVELLAQNYYKLTPKTGVHGSFADVGWLQFSFHQPDASGIIITRNEPIE